MDDNLRTVIESNRTLRITNEILKTKKRKVYQWFLDVAENPPDGIVPTGRPHTMRPMIQSIDADEINGMSVPVPWSHGTICDRCWIKEGGIKGLCYGKHIKGCAGVPSDFLVRGHP